MGYAQIAGLPPVYGLYAAVIPAVIYVLFASSRRVMFGTDAVIVSMIGGGLAVVAGADTDRLPILASVCALIIGVLFVLFSILKLGVIAQYLSKPTMAGFISGLAFTILVTQIPKITEVATRDGTLISLFDTVVHFGQTNWYSLAAGVVTIIALLVAKYFWRRLPAAIIILVFFTVISAVFNWPTKGVDIVGDVPAGLAGFSIPFVTWNEFTYLLTVCFATTIVMFADTLLTARSFALKNGDRFNNDHELGAVGLANISAGLFGAMPGSASASRGAAAESAGMRTQATQIFAAIAIAIVLLFLTGLLYYMPTSVLATIVLVAVINLIEFRLFARLYRTRPQEFWIMTVTALAVIVLGTLPGVLISVVMSVGDFFLRASRPAEAELGFIPGHDGYYNLDLHHDVKRVPGVSVYRFGAALFYANHEVFEKRVRALAKQKNVRAVVIAADAITDIDTTAADGLKLLTSKLKADNVQLYFSGLTTSVRKLLLSYHAGIEASHTTKTIDDAIRKAKV